MATVRHLGLLPRGLCYTQTELPPPYPNTVAAPSTNWVWPKLTKHEATAAIWKVAQWGCSRDIVPGTNADNTQILSSEKDLVCAFTYFGAFSVTSVSDSILSVILSTGGWSSFTKYFYDGSYYAIAIRAVWGSPPQFADQNTVINNGNLNFTVTVNDISTDFFPIKYWPYDPNDGGGPIYDSATGKQLRPFPS